MNDQMTQSGKVSATVERRSPAAPAQVRTFVEALFTAKRVASDVVVQRIAICRQCDKRRVTPQGVEWCRNCGCRVSSKSKEILNLAAYEENLPKWGCKHPQRKQGKGWPGGNGQSSVGLLFWQGKPVGSVRDDFFQQNRMVLKAGGGTVTKTFVIHHVLKVKSSDTAFRVVEPVQEN